MRAASQRRLDRPTGLLCCAALGRRGITFLEIQHAESHLERGRTGRI